MRKNYITRMLPEVCGRAWLRIAWLLVSVLTALYFGFLHFDAGGALQFVQSFGYWFIAAAFLLLLVQLVKLVREHGVWSCGIGPRREVLWAVGYVLLVSVILLQSQPSYFKVVMDEPVLAATSYSMHQDREVVATMRGYEMEGSFHLLGGVVDKRPLFFPLLMSVLHDLTGYRAYQGLVLNALLTPIFLGLAFLCGARIERRWGGYLAVALWATVPLLPMVATSGGFDLLNLVMMALVAMAGYLYLQSATPGRLNILVVLAVLLAQTRYESVLFVFPVGLLVLYSWWRARQIFLTWSVVLAPLLLIIYPLQRKVTNAYEGFWQMPAAIETPFAPAYVPDNLGHAMAYFFHSGIELPNSWLLSILFLAAVPLLLFVAWRKRKAGGSTAEMHFYWIVVGFGSVITLNFLLLMAYHWGQLDDILATRLVLPFIFLQVIVILIAYAQLAHRRGIGVGFAALIFIFFMLKTRPTCARTDFLPWGLAQQKVEWVMEKAAAYRGQQALFVTGNHVAPLIEGVSAVTIEDALSAKAKIDLHLRMGTFSGVYIVMVHPTKIVDLDKHQDLHTASQQNPALREVFKMRKLEEHRLNPAAYISLHKVEAVRLTAAERLTVDAGETSVSYTGKMNYSDPDLIDAFIMSLPK